MKTYVLLALALLGLAAPDSEAVWKDFAAQMRAGGIEEDRIDPYYPQLREPLREFLRGIARDARPEDWSAKPELYRVEDQVHGVIALTGSDGKKRPYCFTLRVDDSGWRVQHLESIFIRLDQTGPLPATRFPDVTAAQKAWMTDERRTTEQVRIYNLLAKEKGREFALRFLMDGEGYALEARTWVPFVARWKAFVLFVCWEQANLFGAPVTLESLEERSAVIRLEPRWFRLYKQTSHLRKMIPEAEYEEIFEARWRDRARAAGWTLAIERKGGEAVFRLTR